MKDSLTIFIKACNKKQSKVANIFERKILFRTLPRTLLQISCDIILYFPVVVKSIIGPDDSLFRRFEILTISARGSTHCGVKLRLLGEMLEVS